LHYRIEVPRQSNVVIHMRAGDLDVHGILGSVNADLLAGNRDLRVAESRHYHTVSASVTAWPYRPSLARGYGWPVALLRGERRRWLRPARSAASGAAYDPLGIGVRSVSAASGLIVVGRSSDPQSCLGEDWAAVERSLIMTVVQLGGAGWAPMPTRRESPDACHCPISTAGSPCRSARFGGS
jgi:hypothetical protein